MWGAVWEKIMAPRHDNAASATASKARPIDTAAKRAKLPTRKNPYWHGVSGGRGGVSLGYRKGQRGGAWIVKVVIDGERVEERLAAADDDGAGGGALSFPAAVAAALEWSKRQFAIFEANRTIDGHGIPTVRAIVEDYAAKRKRVSGRKSSADHLLGHLPADCALARTNLAHITSEKIEGWVKQLERKTASKGEPAAAVPLTAATHNRLLGDLRAALNVALDKHRRQLPGHVAAEVKTGTKNEPVGDVTRMQLLTDAEVCALIDAAFEVDEDFGFLVLIAASTGARYSQIVRLTVADVQVARLRIMMPGSRKGRRRVARKPAAVPVSSAVVERLQPLLQGRAGREPLLLRWVMKRVGGAEGWIRDKRRPWGPAFEVGDFWEKTLAAAGMDGETIMYAFRHSSIVRGLVAGLPVRLVAALHDTSVVMIEKHYSAYITDATEDIVRRHVLTIGAVAPHLVAAE